MNIDRIPPDIHFNENGEIVWTPRLIDFNARAYTRGHTVTADEFNTELIKQTYQGNYNTDTISVLTRLYGTVNRNSVVALEKATTAESVSKQALEDVTKVLDSVTDITERAETAVERAEETLATIDEFATDEDIANALKDYYTITEVDDLIKNVEVDLSDYFKKSETYSRTEIDNKISLIPKFSIKVVTTLPIENISATTVYLVKDYTITSNLYTEYIYVNGAWETLGVQKVDLSNYYTKEEVDDKLANLEVDIDFSDYYTKTETDGLVSALQVNVSKKLDRVDGSTSTALYGVGSSGQQVMFPVAQGTETNAIVRRSGQQIKVPLTPSADNDATSKSYVDGLVNGIEIPDDYLPNTTKYGSSIDLSINETTYVVTAQLKDQDGNNLGSAKTIDLPLESVVVSGSYDNATKKVVLTLKDGSNVEFSVADLVSGLQSEITDLDTIRSNASAGKSASDTIAGYGDIVGYNKQEVVNEAKTKYKKVPTLPSSAEVEDNTVYLLQHTENGSVYYTEHIYKDGQWEQFGSNADVDIVGILDNTTKIATQLGGFSAGLGSSVVGSGGAIGENALAGSGGAIGENTRTSKGFAGGYNAQTLKKIDENTTSTSDAIQLGTGTNYKEKSLQVYDDNIYDANTHTLTVKNIELNGEDINNLLGGDLDKHYPVGSVFITTKPDDPAELFGGKWEQIQDRFLLGAGDTYTEIYKDNGDGTYEGIGGEATHVLTIDEMPSHNHSINQSTKTTSHTASWVVAGSSSGVVDDDYDAIGLTGGNQAHNNMPPYATVYMWYRYE